MYAWILIKYQLHFDFLVVLTPPKVLSTPLPCFMIIVLLKSAFLFFCTNEWWAITSNNILSFSKPLAVQIEIREFSAPLQPRCLSLSKGFPLLRETAKICYCCSQPFYSSFIALVEVILKRRSSAACFVRDLLLTNIIFSWQIGSLSLITQLSFIKRSDRLRFKDMMIVNKCSWR